jgi:hypothetical protein
MYGMPHGHSRSTNLFWMISLSKLTERPVYCRDEICKLTGLYRMMLYIAPDYFRREMLIDLSSVHDISLSELFFLEGFYTPDGKQLKESSVMSLR